MKIAFCVECGASLKKNSETHYICKNGHNFWNNPKCAACVVFRRGRDILLAVRADEPYKGMLDVIGGYLEYNESPIDAAIREVYEETTLKIKQDDLIVLGAFTAEYEPNISATTIIYECTKWKSNPAAQDDVKDLFWGSPKLITTERFAWKSKDLVGVVSKIMARP